MKLNELQALVCQFRDARNWKQFHNGKDMALSLSLEAAELMELTQWKNEQEIQEYFTANPEVLGDELADVLYWVLLIANDYKTDLAAALQDKIAKNDKKYPLELSINSKAKYQELKADQSKE